jgi:type 1 glutamine amidotransferase
VLLLAALVAAEAAHGKAAESADKPWLEFSGKRGPGSEKTIVLIAADEEYRSEQTLPQLARILSERHGFRTIVLFAIDPADGTINPNVNNNIPGLENLKRADLAILFIRWRNLPDDQMKAIIDYAESGKPLIGMRTSTHPFNLKEGLYRKYSWDHKGADYEGGFGRQVFGETWIEHHGAHGKEGTRGIPAPEQEKNPILRGIEPGTIFGPSDVYRVRLPLPGDSVPLVLGQVTQTLSADSAPVDGAKNNPMMPVAWTRTYRGARVITTTMGAAQDFAHEGTRLMLVNAVYWTLGIERRIPRKSDVRFVGTFTPLPFGFRKFEDWKPGRRPRD